MDSIRNEVILTAASEYVWWALTESARVTEWLTNEAHIEPRLGGAFELFWDPTNHEINSTIGCVITTFEPNRHLGFTWKGPVHLAETMNHEGSLTGVMVTLSAAEGGTRLVLEHTGWGEGDEWAQARQWHVRAWEVALESLQQALASGQGNLCCAPE